jgi:phage-related protein
MWGILVGIFTGIWNGIETVALTLATVISTIWSIIRPILNPLWSGAKWLYGNVLKPFWQWAKDHLERLKELYDDHVKPIVDRIYSVIRQVKKFWNDLLQPVFDGISALQQLLVVTRLNQTVFGQWLDGELGKLYQILTDFDQRFLKPLNAVLHVLNDIVLDIDGAFRYAITIETTGKHINSIARQWWNTSLKNIDSVRFGDGTLTRLKPSPFQPIVDGLVQQLEGNDSIFASNVDDARTIFGAVISGQYAIVDDFIRGAAPPGSLPN